MIEILLGIKKGIYISRNSIYFREINILYLRSSKKKEILDTICDTNEVNSIKILRQSEIQNYSHPLQSLHIAISYWIYWVHPTITEKENDLQGRKFSFK